MTSTKSRSLPSVRFHPQNDFYGGVGSFRSRRVFFLILIIFLAFSHAESQTIKGAYSVKRNEAQTKELVVLLSSDSTIAQVQELLFGRVYDEELADLLVFIDKTGHYLQESGSSPIENRSAKFALIRKGDIRSALFGEKYVYVMVFVAERIDDVRSVAKPIPKKDILAQEPENKGKSAAEPGSKDSSGEPSETTKLTMPLSVSLASLDSAPTSGEFLLYTVVKNVFSGLDVSKAEKPAKPDDLVDSPLSMAEIGPLGSDRVFFGIKKIALAENTINRVSIKEELENGSNSYLATFGNYSSSSITSSIGLIFTNRFGYEMDKPAPADGFVFVNFYLSRPQMPSSRYPRDWFKVLMRKMSLSVVVGTKISQSVFDDVFFGLNVGHFIGDFGFLIGANYKMRTLKNGDQDKKERRPHFACGFNILFLEVRPCVSESARKPGGVTRR